MLQRYVSFFHSAEDDYSMTRAFAPRMPMFTLYQDAADEKPYFMHGMMYYT